MTEHEWRKKDNCPETEDQEKSEESNSDKNNKEEKNVGINVWRTGQDHSEP